MIRSFGFFHLTLCSAFITLTGVSAPAADFTGPVSGYAFDTENGAILPINGFPGASLLGSPLNLPVTLQSVVIRQEKNVAVGIVKESGAIARITSLTTNPQATIHDGLLSKFDLVVLNGTGEFAAAYSRSDAKLIRLRNADIESSVSTAEYGDVIVAAADETAVLFGTRTHLYRWTGDTVALLGNFDDITSVVVLNEGRDAVVADKGKNSVYLVSDLSGNRAISLLAGEKEGISNPVAVCIGKDNRLVIANGHSTALVMDLSSRSVLASMFVAAQPTRCEALSSTSLLVLNDVGSSPLVLVDVSELTSYFVPVSKR